MQNNSIVNIDLLEAAQKGEKVAENKLFECLSARIRNLVKYILMKRYHSMDRSVLEEDVKDITQNILITIHKKFKNKKFDSGFIAWTNRILHFNIGNYMSKKKRTDNLFEKPDSDRKYPVFKINDIVEEITHAELLTIIRKNISKLDPICKKIMLVFFEGGGRENIVADFPGVPIGTIDNKIYRCRKKLKERVLRAGCVK